MLLFTYPSPPQRQRGHGQRCDTGVPGGPGGPPGRAQVPGDPVWRGPVRPGPGRHGAHPRRRPDGLPALPQVDGARAGDHFSQDTSFERSAKQTNFYKIESAL